VEASSTPTICRLPDSRRHQLSAIALWHPANLKKASDELAATIRATLRAEAKQTD
jgi:hypothetical protein